MNSLLLVHVVFAYPLQHSEVDTRGLLHIYFVPLRQWVTLKNEVNSAPGLFLPNIMVFARRTVKFPQCACRRLPPFLPALLVGDVGGGGSHT